MIHYLTHEEIDKACWDRCIQQAGNTILYAYSWYLDCVSPGWEALVVDQYVAVFPLTCRRKFGIRYLAQPMFAQQLGIFSIYPLSASIIGAMLEAIPSKFLHTHITLNSANCLEFPGRHEHTNILDLNKPYAAIYTGYSNDTKRNLKKNTHRNLQRTTVGIQEVFAMYQTHIWDKTPGFRTKDFKTFEQLQSRLVHKLGSISTGIVYQQQLCATGVFFIGDDKIIFVLGASTPLGKKVGAMRFMMDTVIRQFAGKPYHLDFEGSNAGGVDYLYKSFGSRRITFPVIRETKYAWLEKAIDVKQWIQLTLRKARRAGGVASSNLMNKSADIIF